MIVRRILSFLISLVLVSLGIGFAPSANAVDEVDVAVTVIGGDMMFYYKVTAVGATSFDFEVYRDSGKTDRQGGYSIDAWPGGVTEGTYGWRSLTNEQAYYIEVTANNVSDSPIGSREVVVTPTAAPAGTTSSFVSTSVTGFDEGFQIYADQTDGSRLGTLYYVFDALDDSYVKGLGTFGYPSRTTLLTPYSFSSANFSGYTWLDNDRTYYIKVVNIGEGGFSAWRETEDFTTVKTPTQPLVTTAAAGHNGADVFFTPPSTIAQDDSTMVIAGYQVQYTLNNGVSWVTPSAENVVVSDSGVNTKRARINQLDPALTYIFRLAAIVGVNNGAWSGPSSSVTPLKLATGVVWSPTNTAMTGTSGTIIPNASATTNSDGELSYSVTSAGSSGCTVDPSTGVVNYASPGTCVVSARAAETATYESGSTQVSFSIVAPTPVGGGTSGGGSASGPVSTPVEEPASTITTPAPAPIDGSEPTTPVEVVPVNIPNPASVTSEEFAAITPAQISLITAQVFRELPASAIAALTAEQASALTPSQINTIQPLKAAELSPAAVAALSPEQVSALRPRAVASLQPAVIAQMSGEQLQALRPAAIFKLTESQLRSISPDQVTAFTREQLRSMTSTQLSQLLPGAVGAMEPAQVRTLKLDAVRELLPAQIEALSPDQLSAMRPAQLRALTTDQVSALTPAQLAGLSASQLRQLRG